MSAWPTWGGCASVRSPTAWRIRRGLLASSLADGSRAAENALRVQVYGTIDEANSWIGVGRAFAADDLLDATLEVLQPGEKSHDH